MLLLTVLTCPCQTIAQKARAQLAESDRARQTETDKAARLELRLQAVGRLVGGWVGGVGEVACGVSAIVRGTDSQCLLFCAESFDSSSQSRRDSG